MSISIGVFFSLFQLVVYLTPQVVLAQGVGISNTMLIPDPSAMLQINADSSGLLIPRTQTSAILNPADGLMVYDTLLNHIMLYDGSNWTRLLKESSFSFFFSDRDGDSYGDKYGALYSLYPLPGYVADSLDCDDLNSLMHPGATEMCDGVDNNCDGVIDEGDLCPTFQTCENGICVSCCSNNGGSVCSSSTNLGTICGDAGGSPINVSGCGNAWYKVTLQECDNSPIPNDLVITVLLNNIPSGMDYDLKLFAPCTTLVGSSDNSGSQSEQIIVTIPDLLGSSQTTVFYVQVILWSGQYCLDWNLTITGN